MKDLKRISRIAFIIVIMLSLCYKINAQTVINVSNGGTYYLCIGTAYDIVIPGPPGTGESIGGDNWEWGGVDNIVDNGSTPATFNNFTVNNFYFVSGTCATNWTNEAEVTANSAGSMTVSIVQFTCVGNNFTAYMSFTLVPYTTSISGTTSFCTYSNETYTCTTNVPGVGTNGYTWTNPSFLSGSSTTNTDATTTTGSGSGNVSVTVSGSPGCPTGSASNTGTLAITSYPTSLPAPSTLTFSQYSHTCEFNANTNTISGATEYQFSANSSFTSLYEGTDPGPATETGPFSASTAYTIYVHAGNSCVPGTWGTSSAPFHKTTPAAPPHCQNSPIKPDNQSVVSEDFKIYPNPTSNMLNIEYPTVSNDPTDETCVVYDMLGHKVANWTLPYSGNKVDEDVSILQNGVYLYVISSGSNILTRGKFVVQK